MAAPVGSYALSVNGSLSNPNYVLAATKPPGTGVILPPQGIRYARWH